MKQNVNIEKININEIENNIDDRNMTFLLTDWRD